MRYVLTLAAGACIGIGVGLVSGNEVASGFIAVGITWALLVLTRQV